MSNSASFHKNYSRLLLLAPIALTIFLSYLATKGLLILCGVPVAFSLSAAVLTATVLALTYTAFLNLIGSTTARTYYEKPVALHQKEPSSIYQLLRYKISFIADFCLNIT